MLPEPASPQPFPYTTLFRSEARQRPCPEIAPAGGQPVQRRGGGHVALPLARYRQGRHQFWNDGHCLAPIAGSACRLGGAEAIFRSEEHTSELQSRENLVCRL